MGKATRISAEIDAGREKNKDGAGRNSIDGVERHEGPSVIQDTADLIKSKPGEGLKSADEAGSEKKDSRDGR